MRRSSCQASTSAGTFGWRPAKSGGRQPNTDQVESSIRRPLILAAGLTYSRFIRPSRTAPVNIASLAVLPLDNPSNDPAQEYFADGMMEELINSARLLHQASGCRSRRGATPDESAERERYGWNDTGNANRLAGHYSSRR